jgi:bacterioferritin-associated ferredoxin
VYLCICNAIKTAEFRACARACPGDAEAVYQRLGKKPQCGQCLDDAAELLEEVRQDQQRPVPFAA